MSSFTNILGILLFGLLLNTCSSSYKPRTTVNHAGHETQWDRDKIEQNKKFEDASKPSQSQLKTWKEEEKNCVVMSKLQMQKSQASGCQPIDSREGHGDGMYCCEAQD